MKPTFRFRDGRSKNSNGDAEVFYSVVHECERRAAVAAEASVSDSAGAVLLDLALRDGEAFLRQREERQHVGPGLTLALSAVTDADVDLRPVDAALIPNRTASTTARDWHNPKCGLRA